MRLTRIHEVFDGMRCPRCGFPDPYELADNRLKCRDCYHRYSPKKMNDDSDILLRFILGEPVRKAAKGLKFSYNKVFFKYREYRKEIAEYSDKEGIPKQPSIADIMKGKKIKGHEDFCEFAKESLNQPGGIRKENVLFYQRELEFRYHYRDLNPWEFYDIVFKIHFVKIMPFVFGAGNQ